MTGGNARSVLVTGFRLSLAGPSPARSAGMTGTDVAVKLREPSEHLRRPDRAWAIRGGRSPDGAKDEPSELRFVYISLERAVLTVPRSGKRSPISGRAAPG